MNDKEFVIRATQMADYILNYVSTVSERPVAVDTNRVTPGFLAKELPLEAPQEGESFDKILQDFEEKLMPGMVHWEHPRFHAYFPAAHSYPSILGEMMSDFIGVSGMEWTLSPAAAELESIVTDWYGQLMGLPDQFLRYAEGSRGGGVIQNSNSECVFLAMLTARDEFLDSLRQKEGQDEPHRMTHLTRLMAYCSKETHSCAEKAARLLLVNIRVLDADHEYRLRGETLAKVVKRDRELGMVPFFVILTMGTTSCCSCDPIDEIGPICKEYGMWLHVDAAYAGSAMICPEFRYLMKGIEHAKSYNVNPAKLALVNLECSVLFTTDRSKFDCTIVEDKTEQWFDRADPTHYTARRCRAFKLWFVFSCYGMEGLQKHIRNHVHLAELFARKVEADERFELIQSRLGLVCFRLRGSNTLNRLLLKQLKDSCKVHMIGTSLQGRFTLRFCVCYHAATESDIEYAWNLIAEYATSLKVDLVECIGGEESTSSSP